MPVINNAIQASGLLKQISAAAYRRQDIQEIEQLALTLKKQIEDALIPFYEKHMGLYLSDQLFPGHREALSPSQAQLLVT